MTKQTAEFSWNILTIFKDAYKRWLSQFLRYLGAYFLFIGVWIGMHIGIVLIGTIISFIWIIFLKNTFIIPIIFCIGILASLVISLYLFSFLTLTTVVLFTKENQGIFASIRSVKPLVWGYLWMGILCAVFIIGLFPFGLLSLFIIPILWSFWSSFTTFVYLEQKFKGLQNLWVSRALYNQRFTLLFWRVFLIFGIGLLIYLSHIIAAYIIGTQGNLYIFVLLFSSILNFLYISYLVCFLYELYRRLEKPKEVKVPKIWVGLSIIGWFFNIILVIVLSSLVTQFIPVAHHVFPLLQQNLHTPPHDPNTLYYTTEFNKPVQTPDRLFTFLSSQRKRDITLTKNGEFILVNISLKNTGKGTISYSPYDFFIINRLGILQGPAFTFALADEYMLGSGKLAIGATKTGVVVFQANQSDAPFTVLYKPFIGNEVKPFTVALAI